MSAGLVERASTTTAPAAVSQLRRISSDIGPLLRGEPRHPNYFDLKNPE
jgi:hypothetical protein